MLGFGVIPCNSPDHVESVVAMALYLTDPNKHDQYLKVKLKDSFERGQI